MKITLLPVKQRTQRQQAFIETQILALWGNNPELENLIKTAVESFFIGRFNTKEFQSLLQRVTPRQIVDSIQMHKLNKKAVYAAKLQMMRNFINKLERSIKKTTIYTASDPRAQELFQFVKNNFSVDEQREILKKWHEMTPKGLSINELLREILPTIRRFSHIDEESYQRRID